MSDETENAERMGMFEERLATFSVRCLNMLEALPRNGIGVANFRDQLARSATGIAANRSRSNGPRCVIVRATLA